LFQARNYEAPEPTWVLPAGDRVASLGDLILLVQSLGVRSCILSCTRQRMGDGGRRPIMTRSLL
jgi:hypothetical protein